MADIMTGDGRAIADEARSLTPLPSQPSTWIWPIEQPSWNHDLTAWCKGIQLFSSLAFYLQFGASITLITGLPLYVKPY